MQTWFYNKEFGDSSHLVEIKQTQAEADFRKDIMALQQQVK